MALFCLKLNTFVLVLATRSPIREPSPTPHAAAAAPHPAPAAAPHPAPAYQSSTERLSLVTLSKFNVLEKAVEEIKDRVYGSMPKNEEILETVRYVQYSTSYLPQDFRKRHIRERTFEEIKLFCNRYKFHLGKTSNDTGQAGFTKKSRYEFADPKPI